MRIKYLPWLTLFLLAGTNAVSADTRFFYEPTIHGDRIAFVHGDDIWIVSTDGGQARPLTRDGSPKRNLQFSDDGSTLAYSAKVDGNVDVYTVMIGGVEAAPTRRTWHPADDLVWDWTKKNELLFSSGRNQWDQYKELYILSLDSGQPVRLRVGKASSASLSPDQRRLVMAPIVDSSNTWKRYRGGRALPLWIVDLDDFSHKAIPHQPATDMFPVWSADTIYFRSDRSGVRRIHAYNTVSGEVLVVDAGIDADIDAFDIDGDQIAFVSEGFLYYLDRQLESARRLSVEVRHTDPDMAQPSERNVIGEMKHEVLSPNGRLIAFEARGDIFVVETDRPKSRNLTRSPGAGDREPIWADDSNHVAFLSDADGEYGYHVLSVVNPDETERMIPLGSGGYGFNARFSPDGRHLAYVDHTGHAWSAYIDGGSFKRVDVQTSLFAVPVWSADSSKLYLQTMDARSGYSALVSVEIDGGTVSRLTDPMMTVRSPSLSADGNFLIFLGSSTAGPTMTRYDFSKVLYGNDAIWFAYSIDLGSGEVKRLGSKTGNYSAVTALSNGLLLFQSAEKYDLWNDSTTAGEPHLQVPKAYLYDPRADIEISPPPINGEFSVHPQSSTTLVHWEDKLLLLPLNADGISDVKPIALSEAIVIVDELAETRQIFMESWRKARDFFYDPGLHGVDWPAMRDHYYAWLEDVHHEGDLYFVLSKLASELENSHIKVLQPIEFETKSTERPNVPMLGADFDLDNSGYRVERVLKAPIWSSVTSPLPLDVQGMYLSSINGQAVHKSAPLHKYLSVANTGSLTLQFGRSNGESLLEVSVIPLTAVEEVSLRYRDWVERNRAWVDEVSDSRVAYLHQPDTSEGGLREFIRYFYPQANKDAIIIDERFNKGGADPDFQLDVLGRTPFLLYAPRDIPYFPSPNSAIAGPKVMLINAEAGSGGDVFPYQFKRRNLGTLIGTRTWGGVNGGFRESWPDRAIDGGSLSIPDLGSYSPEGNYILENDGMSPDIQVEFYPADYAAGRDPQLARAVEFLLQELEEFRPMPESVDRALIDR